MKSKQFAVTLVCAIACGNEGGKLPAASNLTASRHRLSIEVTGPIGSAHLVSQPAGITCPGTCSAYFDDGTSVVIDISLPPAQGACIAGVEGCLNASNCTTLMNEDKRVSWHFIDCRLPSPPPGKHRLSVEAIGPIGTGHLVSKPAGIVCPGTCTADFDDGTTVFVDISLAHQGDQVCISATPGCLNASNCQVTMDRDRAVSWQFVDCRR